MTYQDYIIKCEVAKTVFQIGVTSALQVENVTPEQRLTWIAKDLKELETELEQLRNKYDEQDVVGDPFVLEVK